MKNETEDQQWWHLRVLFPYNETPLGHQLCLHLRTEKVPLIGFLSR